MAQLAHIAVATVLWIAASTTLATAADRFDIAYAIERDGRRMTGTIEGCEYFLSCSKQLDGVRVSVMLLRDRDKLRASVSVHDRDRCCLFSGGERTLRIDVSDRQSAPLFMGWERLRNEVIRNPRVGTLHLAFARR